MRIVLDTDVVSLHRARRLPARLSRHLVGNELCIAFAAGAQLRGRPRPQNDTWIAACCIKSGLPLVTLNRRDFADFAEHDGLVLL